MDVYHAQTLCWQVTGVQQDGRRMLGTLAALGVCCMLMATRWLVEGLNTCSRTNNTKQQDSCH